MAHVHYVVEALNDDGDWEGPLPPFMALEHALDGARSIAVDYPRGVKVMRVIVDQELVWTNAYHDAAKEARP